MGDTETSKGSVRIGRGRWNENAIPFQLVDVAPDAIDLAALRLTWLQRYGSWIDDCQLTADGIAVLIKPAKFEVFVSSGGWKHAEDTDAADGLHAEIMALLQPETDCIEGDEDVLE